jgi:5-methylcytosine-specific restriction endonuclease McrA
MMKVKKVKGLLSHSFPVLDHGEFYEVLLDRVINEIEKKKGVVRVERTKKDVQGFSKNNELNQNTTQRSFRRYIGQEIKRTVWTRDQGRCAFVDSSSGRRCGSQYQFEFDHFKPFSRGGPTSYENLRG